MHSSSSYLGIIGLIVIDYVFFRNAFKPIWIEYFDIKRIINNGIFTKGTIVDFSEKTDLDQRQQFSPIVRFQDDSGDVHTIDSNDYRLVKKEISIVVDICYDKLQPSRAIVNPKSKILFKKFLMIFIIIGLLILNVGVLSKIFQ